MREKLVECMLVVLKAGHGHQEALDHLPGLTSVVGFRVGALQTVQSCLNGLGGKNSDNSYFKIVTIHLRSENVQCSVFKFTNSNAMRLN